MDARIRRILIFVIIVGTGTVLLYADLPLLFILPLIIAVGFLLLILLGAIPIAELKTYFSRSAGKPAPAPAAAKPEAKAPAVPPAAKKGRFSFSLGSLFKKRETGKGPSPAVRPPQKGVPEPARKPRFSFSIGPLFAGKKEKPAPVAAPKPQPAAAAGKKRGVSFHMGSLVSSFRAFSAILTAKKEKDPDKLKKIDSMLDQTVSEKVDLTPPPPVAVPVAVPAAAGATAGGGGGMVPVTAGEEDPFLSLSNDELEAGLLDGLDEEDAGPPAAAPPGESPAGPLSIPDAGADIPLADADIPVPPSDVDAAAGDILKANEAGGEAALPDLEGLDSIDENLGELDSLTLDSAELDEDEDEDEEKTGPATAPAPAPGAAATPGSPGWIDTKVAGADTGAVSTAPDSKRSDQSEMAAFASASGGDDDMLSSLAADIKTVKKELDISLLRELKDFRAPGKAIETELTDLYTTMNAAVEKQRKLRPAPAKKKPQPK